MHGGGKSVASMFDRKGGSGGGVALICRPDFLSMSNFLFIFFTLQATFSKSGGAIQPRRRLEL